jgi:hypothetical protein
MDKFTTNAQRSEYFHRFFQNMIQIEDLQNTQFVINNTQNTKVAVIVEPRKHEFFEEVIRNVMFILPKDWNLHIITHKDHKEWVESLFPNWQIKISTIEKPNFTVDDYNQFLMTESFWTNIDEENILIFQTDVMLFNDNIDDFIQYDFIGANYFDVNHTSVNNGGNNGGFSFRHKTAMIDCIQKLSQRDIHNYLLSNNKGIYGLIPEDIYFSNSCEILNKKLCPVSERSKFSIEDANKEPFIYFKPIGCHRFMFHDLSKIIMQILESSPYTSKWIVPI